MTKFDVVIVGGGCAGLSAAIGLARLGFAAVVVETASTPGDDGIGGVCFAENLAQADILGPQGVESLAWERRIVERGCFVSDGRRLLGTTYRDADAFRHCYTVLRPRFNAHLARIAQAHGVTLQTDTTVESLIREGRRIIGLATSRGPLYGDLVFIAEGDAGHLVSREGYDRSNDPRDAATFRYCLQQVVDLPPGTVEERFRVGADRGVAHELLLRNPVSMPLNARGFLCSNRQSVTLGIVLSMENLRRHFDDEPYRLLDWFADMPVLRPWLREGRRGAWTVRLLRAGGLRDVPYLVEDGLVIGGAAAGLGVDFPVLNTIGPAMATALQAVRAMAAIRGEGGDFDREHLTRHYLEPLQRMRCWRDVEFLSRWPNYVKRTQVLFDGEMDFVLDSAEIWARPCRWLPRKLLSWCRLLGGVAWTQWGQWLDDLFRAGHALRFREVTPRPAPTRLILDGALNAFRDLVRKPRPHLPPAGTLHIHYRSAENSEAVNETPALLRRWFGRFRPVLASVGRILYGGDDMQLSAKLTTTIELLMRQINLIDAIALVVLGSLAALTSTLLSVLGLTRKKEVASGKWLVVSKEEDASSLTTNHLPLATLPIVHVVWRSSHPQQRADAVRELPHLCPTNVFEIHGEPPDAVRVIVHGERCIHCEACWRSNRAVDWGRSLQGANDSSLPRPASAPNEEQDEISRLLEQLEGKLSEFEESLTRNLAAIDRPRSDYLEMLARYAQQLAVRIGEVLQEEDRPLDDVVRRQALKFASTIVALTEQRARRTWDGRFAWAAADGRLLRQHHLPALRRLLGGDAVADWRQEYPSLTPRLDEYSSLTASNIDNACVKHLLADIAARRYLLETLRQTSLAVEQSSRATLLAALATEVQEGLSARTSELHALVFGGEKTSMASSPSTIHHLPSTIHRADAEQIRVLLDIPGDWPTLTQRRALLAEREEIFKAEERLIALTRDEGESSDETEMSAGLARQVAYVLAGKLLLLRTHDGLERGCDAECAVVLLRVWLDYAATRLDEFTILLRDDSRPQFGSGDRPLVEFGSGPPPRTVAEYLAAESSYTCGDYLLSAVDLLQPRLTPEMVDDAQQADLVVKRAVSSSIAGASAANLLRGAADLRASLRDRPRREEFSYLADALAWELAGRLAHSPKRSIELELAGARLIVAELRQHDSVLSERCVILNELVGEVLPRWRRGGEERVRHLNRDVLELEALKADFRQRLTAVGDAYGSALADNADVQASCFALAEAAAWLKAADSVLGRMGWLSRLNTAKEREEPSLRQALGRRILAHCYAEIRDRLFRFDEDLAALRRGYYAPHVRAAALLSPK